MKKLVMVVTILALTLTLSSCSNQTKYKYCGVDKNGENEVWYLVESYELSENNEYYNLTLLNGRNEKVYIENTTMVCIDTEVVIDDKEKTSK